MFASGVAIAREFVLDGGFSSSGGIVLDRAEIDGTLDFSGKPHDVRTHRPQGRRLREQIHDAVLDDRYDKAVISLVDARLDRLIMPDKAADRPLGIVDLSRARVGSYEDFAEAWPPPKLRSRRGQDDHDHLVLDGFVYEHLETPSGIPANKDGKHAASSTQRPCARNGSRPIAR